VPDDAAVYVAVSTDTSSDQWRIAQELFDRAGLGPVLDRVAPAVETAGEPAVRRDDLARLMGGEVALVVTPPALAAGLGPTAREAAAPEARGLAVIVRAADAEEAETTARTLLRQAASARDARIETRDYSGVEIASLPAGNGGGALARIGPFLGLAETAADLEPLIDAQAGVRPPLAKSEAFVRARQALGDEFLVYGYVDAAVFLPAMRAGLETEIGMPAGSALAPLDARISVSLRADEPGFRLETVAVPTGPVAPLTAQRMDPAALATRVPADTMLFAAGSELGRLPALDLFGMAVAEGVAGTLGGVPSDVDPFLAAERLLTFNPRDDLLRQLTGAFAFAVSVSALDPAAVDAALISGVGDPAILNDALSKSALLINAGFYDQGVDGSVRRVETDGFPTHRLLATLPALDTTLRAEFGVVDDSFLLSYGQPLSDLSASPATALADSPRYQAVMATLPAAPATILYVDLGQAIPLARVYLDQALTAALARLPEQGSRFTREEVATLDLTAIEAFAVAGYEQDGLRRTSAILFIGE
jgi:hypothetical protein